MPGLPEKYRPTGIELDCQRDAQKKRREDDQAHSSGRDIEHAFDRQIKRRERGAGYLERRYIAKCGNARGREKVDRIARDDVNVDWELGQLVGEAGELREVFLIGQDDDV